MNKEYAKLKALCEIEGCACEEEHKIRQMESNTPLCMRLWFKIINR